MLLRVQLGHEGSLSSGPAFIRFGLAGLSPSCSPASVSTPHFSHFPRYPQVLPEISSFSFILGLRTLPHLFNWELFKVLALLAFLSTSAFGSEEGRRGTSD